MNLKNYIITQVKKKFWLRLSVLSLFLAVWLVIDEWIKEGYAFHPIEVINPLCHEFWVLILWVLSGVSLYIDKMRGVKNGARKGN